MSYDESGCVFTPVHIQRMTNHKLISHQIPKITTIYGRKHLHTVIAFIHSKHMTTSICGNTCQTHGTLIMGEGCIYGPKHLMFFCIKSMYAKSVDFHQCIICNENKFLQILATFVL